MSLSYLKNIEGGKFIKDYTLNNSLDADYCDGSPVATFTRDNVISTYIDSNGVIQTVSTANTPRYQYGYYDDKTGFILGNKGLMIEGERTNLLTYTDGTSTANNLWTNWTITSVDDLVDGTITKSNVAIPELCSIPNAKSQRIQYTGMATDSNEDFKLMSANTAVGSVVQNDVLTISFWARSQTGNIGVQLSPQIYSRTAVGGALSRYGANTQFGLNLTTSWKKFSITVTITDATSSLCNAGITARKVDNGDTIDIEVYGFQVEKAAFASSWIPTTTASLTRGVETLKYLNLNNRTPNEETICIKFVPLGDFLADGVARKLIDNDLDGRRVITKEYDKSAIYAYANNDQDLLVVAKSVTSPGKDIPHIFTGVFKHATNPDATTLIYANGILDSSDTTNGDWINPTWGDYFYIGSRYDSTDQLYGIVQNIAIYSRALSATEVTNLTANLYTSVSLWEGNTQVPSRFSIFHTHYYPGEPASTAVPTYRYQIWRTLDYWSPSIEGTSWCGLHNGDGDFTGGGADAHWAKLDEAVDLQYSEGRDIMYVIFFTPLWCASNVNQDHPFTAGGHGGNTPPTDNTYLSQFITQLVTRYNTDDIRDNGGAKKIKYLEVWNEPTFAVSATSFFTGTHAQLAAMAKVIYNAAKAVDSSIKILSPGFNALMGNTIIPYLNASDGDTGYGRDYVEGISYHTYEQKFAGFPLMQGVYGDPKYIDLAFRKAISEGGLASSIPIYITETGCGETAGKTSVTGTTATEKAQYIFRVSALYAALGYKMMGWYAHESSLIGSPYNTSIVSAAFDLISELNGKTISKIEINNPVNNFIVYFSDGTSLPILTTNTLDISSVKTGTANIGTSDFMKTIPKKKSRYIKA